MCLNLVIYQVINYQLEVAVPLIHVVSEMSDIVPVN